MEIIEVSPLGCMGPQFSREATSVRGELIVVHFFSRDFSSTEVSSSSPSKTVTCVAVLAVGVVCTGVMNAARTGSYLPIRVASGDPAAESPERVPVASCKGGDTLRGRSHDLDGGRSRACKGIELTSGCGWPNHGVVLMGGGDRRDDAYQRGCGGGGGSGSGTKEGVRIEGIRVDDSGSWCANRVSGLGECFTSNGIARDDGPAGGKEG